MWQSGNDRIRDCLQVMYEFPNLDEKLTMDEVTAYSKSIGLAPIRVKKLGMRSIFSAILNGI